MFARILVPLDGSVSAEEALPVAARIVRNSRGSMHLLRVVGFPLDVAEEYDEDPLLSEQRIETETTVATDYLRRIATLPVLDRIQITTEVAHGLPAQYILAAAGLGGVDLAVLSSHGRTGFRRWVLGSVAHTLAHESTVPYPHPARERNRFSDSTYGRRTIAAYPRPTRWLAACRSRT